MNGCETRARAHPMKGESAWRACVCVVKGGEMRVTEKRKGPSGSMILPLPRRRLLSTELESIERRERGQAF